MSPMTVMLTPQWENDDWWSAYATAIQQARPPAVVIPPPDVRYVTLAAHPRAGPTSWSTILVAASAAMLVVSVILLVWRFA